MNPQIHKYPTALMWVASIAIVLFSGVGIASLLGWHPISFGSQSTVPAAVADVTKQTHKTHAPAPAIATNTSPSRVVCTECGVIESVRVIKNYGNASGLGLVGGAVIGGLLGNQVGSGHGQDAATVAGAVGGAVAGNAIEKNAGLSRSYEVTVRFDDGSGHVFSEANPPAWQSGDHVRVVNGAIRSNG